MLQAMFHMPEDAYKPSETTNFLRDLEAYELEPYGSRSWLFCDFVAYFDPTIPVGKQEPSSSVYEGKDIALSWQASKQVFQFGRGTLSPDIGAETVTHIITRKGYGRSSDMRKHLSL